jgi:hypothetical protein
MYKDQLEEGMESTSVPEEERELRHEVHSECRRMLPPQTKLEPHTPEAEEGADTKVVAPVMKKHEVQWWQPCVDARITQNVEKIRRQC